MSKIHSSGATLVFDMDGTIADFYNVEGWKSYLDKENVFPYKEAKPCVDVEGFKCYLDFMKSCGYHLRIVSWSSKGGSESFNKAVRKAKIEWLKKYGLLKYFDHVQVVKYGTPKHKVIHKRGFQTTEWLLYDDNAFIREEWDDILSGRKSMSTPYSYEARDEKALQEVCATFKEIFSNGLNELINL